MVRTSEALSGAEDEREIDGFVEFVPIEAVTLDAGGGGASFFFRSASLAFVASRSKTESVKDDVPVSAESTSLIVPLSLDTGLIVVVDGLVDFVVAPFISLYKDLPFFVEC